MVAFGVSVFTSAFLLFQVQPVLAKFILPRFGGGAAVWTSCLLFFQVALLAGYAWAHALRRWLPRTHSRVHAVFLGVTLLSIPILPAPGGLDPTAAPAAHILLLLAATVGLPYLALASTGPLLQSWFADRYPGRSPYRLYALSNAGSLLGLLTYPVIVEPGLSRNGQVVGWSAAYLALVLLLLAVAFRSQAAGTPPAAEDVTTALMPRFRQVMSWLALAATASALLMAVTNHISQEVAVVPFLWVLPLSLYLLSFIVTFDSDRWYRRAVFAPLLIACVGAAVWSLGQGLLLDFRVGLLIWSTTLLVLCTCCHGELVRQRPAPAGLTTFYLAIAAGGALGGVFVGIVAPLLFDGYWELHVALGACCALVVDEWLRALRRHRTRGWRPLVALAAAAQIVLGAVLLLDVRSSRSDAVVTSRSFYGALRVELYEDDARGVTVRLLHGQTRHGSQALALPDRLRPADYYGVESGIALAIDSHPRRAAGNLRIGVVGLGTGTLAAYGRPGESIRFWEIDPDVERLARSHFSYLADSKAATDVVLGDARLQMQAELHTDGGGRYDVLAVDAFSSDAIPIHLLTTEAADLYRQLLTPDGLLALHVSNRFVALEPVARALAAHTGMVAVKVRNEADRSRGISRATWIVMVRPGHPFLEDGEVIARGELLDPADRTVVWTDDFASLVPVLDLD